MSARHNIVLPRLLTEEPLNVVVPAHRSVKWALSPEEGTRAIYLRLSLLSAPAHEVIFAVFNAEQFKSYPKANPHWATKASYVDYGLTLEAELSPWYLTISNPTDIPLSIRGSIASGSLP